MNVGKGFLLLLIVAASFFGFYRLVSTMSAEPIQKTQYREWYVDQFALCSARSGKGYLKKNYFTCYNRDGVEIFSTVMNVDK